MDGGTVELPSLHCIAFVMCMLAESDGNRIQVHHINLALPSRDPPAW